MAPLSFETKIFQLEYLLNVAYLLVPAAVVAQVGGIGARRLVCTVNGQISWRCGLAGLSGGDAYITISKERLRKLDLSVGASACVMLTEDKSEYGTEVPEEFQEILNQDERARERFAALKPAMQRYLLNYAGGVKSPDKRLERSLLLLENLKRLPADKVTFRALLGKE